MKLNIAFLWHLHQPYYLDPEENNFLLPWVRLHAAKNYLFIAELFRKFPQLQQNINLVPSLLKQIEHYQKDGLTDTCLVLSEKNAYELTHEEREYILKNFFHAHAETMIYRFPRYRELFERWRGTSGDVGKAMKLFGISEITDLQVLFNLVWLNPLHYADNRNILNIVEKGRLFGEEDKRVVLDFHREIIGRVIERFREIAYEGLAELTVSPFYHPILPILIDSDCAELADPHLEPPPFRIAFPEDALYQVREAKKYFQDIFGVSPDGMWPSEGSVSEDTFELMSKEGFRYTFTDELILSKAITYNFYRDHDGIPDKPEVLYQPYRYKNHDLHIFFRDHYLSDLIGFVYKKWDPGMAAMHLIDKFLKIRNKFIKRGYNPEDYIVSLIFDGENPWEYYHNYGIDFLNELFENLSRADELNVITYREFMDERKGRNFPVIESVKPGSWIDGTFRIWFGHQEDFDAWKYIHDLKLTLYNKDIDPSISADALEYIRIAEGSDWYWWYGDDHFTANLLEFDRLFRKYIKKAYKILNEDPPKELDKEIFSSERLVQAIGEENLYLKVKSRITPVIDGKVTSYYEWVGGAQFSQSPIFGSMHRAGFGIIGLLHAGFDRKNFFIRIDFHDKSLFESGKINIKTDINGSLFNFSIDPIKKQVNLIEGASNAEVVAAFDTILEISIPLSAILEDDKGILKFFLLGISDDVFEERWPESGEFLLEITGEDPSKEEWII